MINSRIIPQQQEIGKKPEVANLNNNVEHLLEKAELLNTYISNAQASLAQKKQTLLLLEPKHAEFPQKISQKQAEIAKISEVITEKLINEIVSANTQLKQLKLQYNEITAEIKNINEEVKQSYGTHEEISNNTIPNLEKNSELKRIDIEELNEQKLKIETGIKSTTAQLQSLKHKKISTLTKILSICSAGVGWIILAIKHHNNQKHNAETDKTALILKKQLETYDQQLLVLEKEIQGTNNEIINIAQQINDNIDYAKSALSKFYTKHKQSTLLQEQNLKLSQNITQTNLNKKALETLLEHPANNSLNLADSEWYSAVIPDFKTRQGLITDLNLLNTQQQISLQRLNADKQAVVTGEQILSNLKIELSSTQSLINDILSPKAQNLPLFPPQPKVPNNDLIVPKLHPADIMKSSALINPQNYEIVDCKSANEVNDYLIELVNILKLDQPEVKRAITTAKNHVDYKDARLEEKYNVLLSRTLHILNFSSQEQLLYRASGLNNVANNQSEDYDRAHVYYSWVFEKLIEEIAPQSKSYAVQVPTNYKKVNDQFGDVVNAVSSNAYPLDQLKNHSARAVNFFANIATLETRLAEKNPNSLLHSYSAILQANFEQLSRKNLSEKDLNAVVDLIIMEEQTKKCSELKNVLTKVITNKTKEKIQEHCKDQKEPTIKQHMLSILLETNISKILENILLNPDYANLNADLNTISEKKLGNIAYEVFNKLNEKIENQKIDKSSLQTLHNQMKPIYQEQLHQQHITQSDHSNLLTGLKIMKLTDIAEDDQKEYNEIENQLKNVRPQYEKFTTQYLALVAKIDNSEKLTYNELAELENEISNLKFKPEIDQTYNRNIHNISRAYKDALNTQELDSLDFSILKQNQASANEAVLAGQDANSIAIPEELNGFLGLGINPDQLLFDADGNESLEVDNSRKDVLTQFTTLNSTPNKTEKELQFYNAMKNELSGLSRKHKFIEKSNDLKLENAHNTEIVNNWDSLVIDRVRHNILNIAMKQADSSTVLLWRLNPEILETKINNYISAIIYENGAKKGLPEWAINHLVNYSDFMMESSSELTKYIFSLRGLPESWAQFIKYDASKQHFYLAFGGPNNTSDAGHKCFHRAIKTLEALSKDEKSRTILNKIADHSPLNLAELEYMKTKYPEKNIPKKKLADNNQQDTKTITDAMYNLKTRNVNAVTVVATEINGAYYEKIFCDIIVTIKEQYSIKKAAESVTIISELSETIYALHDVGEFAKNKHEMLESNLNDVTALVNELKSNLPKISGELDKILTVATSVKNTKDS
jgi:hypothetical protein